MSEMNDKERTLAEQVWKAASSQAVDAGKVVKMLDDGTKSNPVMVSAQRVMVGVMEMVKASMSNHREYVKAYRERYERMIDMCLARLNDPSTSESDKVYFANLLKQISEEVSEDKGRADESNCKLQEKAMDVMGWGALACLAFGGLYLGAKGLRDNDFI